MITEKAYAKINLFLNVIERRADGFHNLEMVMAPVDLHDTLTFSKRSDRDILITSNKLITDNNKDNLVYKIAKHLQDAYKIEEGVSIHIDKEIPMGGGLAGGSADAAATLRGLNELWKLDLTLDDLAKIGILYGSDIPFCVYNKLSIARSKGEKLEFLDVELNGHILLVNPNLHVSTKDVFQSLQVADFEDKNLDVIKQGILHNNLDVVKTNLHNTLEKSTFRIEKEVKKLKELMTSYNGNGVLMSGSGATVFALNIDVDTLINIQKKLPKTYFKKLTFFR